MRKIIDLHIHTNCSDGAMTPKEVIDEAVNNGVSVISIADHDTIDAYSDELFAYAKDKNVKIIPAVEISTKTGKCGFHVLGYNFDMKNENLLKQLSALRNARHDYLYGVAAKLEELGYVVHTSELDKIEAENENLDSENKKLKEQASENSNQEADTNESQNTNRIVVNSGNQEEDTKIVLQEQKNFRQEMNTEDAENIIDSLPAGTEVTLLQEEKYGWKKIEYEGRVGYIKYEVDQ